LLLCLGCDDASSGGTGASPDATVAAPDAAPEAALPDAAPPPVDARGDARVPSPDAAPLVAAWIEVTLVPRRPLYSTDEHPVATAVAYDRVGAPIEVDLAWRVAPPGRAEIDDEQALRFLGEGPGVVVACHRSVCGRAAFHVDANPPVLQVNEPARGVALGGDGSRTIRVRGTATDTGNDVDVRVNGVRVELGEGGAFSLDLPARFGINHVVTTADDGVRRPAVADARDVLWAPAYVDADASGVSLPGALTLRLDQAALDADGPVEIPVGAGELRLAELAQFVEALLSLASVDEALGDPQIADGDGFSLRVEGITLGAPEVDLSFTATGIELFLRMPRLAIEVSGRLTLEGEAIDLGGTLRAGIAAFASLVVRLDDAAGALVVEVAETGVAVESLGGAFADETAQVLVGTLGSRLRAVARDLAVELVDGVVREQLPGVVRQALGSLLDGVAEIPLRFAVGVDGAPPVELMLRMHPTAVTPRRQRTLRLDLEARVEHPAEVVAPHLDPGVPTIAPDEHLDLPGEGFGAALRMGLINALLHEVWRAGVLQLTPRLPPEVEGLFGEIRVDARLPPVVAVAEPGGAFPLEVQIGDMRMITQPPGAPSPDVYALTLRAGLSVHTRGGRVELRVADAPDLEASLISKGSERPISAAALAGLVGAVVWPLVLESVDGGLGFGLDPVALEAGQFAELAPRMQGVTLAPTFTQPPRLEAGRLWLEGGLGVTLELDE